MTVKRETLRFKLSVDDLADLRSRIRLCEGGAGRLRWPGPAAGLPRGRPVVIEAAVRSAGETVFLRGDVDERRPNEASGVWVTIPGADRVLDNCELGLIRRHKRLPAEHLALFETRGQGLLLCRIRDLGTGGA